MNYKFPTIVLIVVTVLGMVLPILAVSAGSVNSSYIGTPKFQVRVENQTSTVLPIELDEPTYGYGKTVTVEVWILGVTDMYAYEFTLKWPGIAANWVLDSYTVEGVWANQFVVLPDAGYDLNLGKASTISYKQVAAALPPSAGVSGNVKLATLKFHIYNDIAYWEPLEFVFCVTDTKVSNSCSQRIPLCPPDNAVVVWKWGSKNQGSGIDPPSVSFTYLPLTPIVNQTVTFNASASQSEYEPMSYRWNFGDGNITTAANPIITHGYTSANTYLVTLNVTDSANHSNATTANINVQAVHDVAVTAINPYRTVIGKDSLTSTKVTIADKGDVTETFNVTLYCGTSQVGTQTVTLSSKQSVILSFPWTTPNAIGNFTLRAEDSQVLGQNNTQDSIMTFNLIRISIPGDLSGDGKVNILDITAAAAAYGTKLGDSKWNANADMNEDGTVNILDLTAIAKEYGKSV